MKIIDIKGRMKGIEITGKVTEKTQPIVKRYKNYAQAMIEDETGKIAINLWRDQVKQVNEGDYIRVKDAFTQRYYGNLTISTWMDIETLDQA